MTICLIHKIKLTGYTVWLLCKSTSLKCVPDEIGREESGGKGGRGRGGGEKEKEDEEGSGMISSF